jgi:hypothetical protein
MLRDGLETQGLQRSTPHGDIITSESYKDSKPCAPTNCIESPPWSRANLRLPMRPRTPLPGTRSNAPIARRFKSYCGGSLLDVSGDDRPRAALVGQRGVRAGRIIRETLNLRLLQAIPNVLVGIGLLFTFLGLTAALYFASQGAAAHDVAQTQLSIRNLLDAAAFKLSSSLIAFAKRACTRVRLLFVLSPMLR